MYRPKVLSKKQYKWVPKLADAVTSKSVLKLKTKYKHSCISQTSKCSDISVIKLVAERPAPSTARGQLTNF